MARTPSRPPVPPKTPNPVARADAARKRKAGAIPPKKGKGTPYDRAREKSVDADGTDGADPSGA